MNTLAAMTLWVLFALVSTAGAANLDVQQELQSTESWREQRIARLKSEDGWLTLVGLFWLKPGENAFGRNPKHRVALDHPALPDTAGSFVVQDGRARFVAAPGSPVTHDGKPVQSMTLQSDKNGEPTTLRAGSLKFFVIERAGRLGVRMRDTAHPLRTSFEGIDYYPVTDEWIVEARFEPHDKRIPIADITGSTDRMLSPGALVFEKDGKEYRIDALLNAPDDDELFLMLADGTSGRETYGAGRYMYVPRPREKGERLLLNFNKAYIPPCAFNDFATCPLPPRQNRLPLRIEAGEKTYGEH